MEHLIKTGLLCAVCELRFGVRTDSHIFFFVCLVFQGRIQLRIQKQYCIVSCSNNGNVFSKFSAYDAFEPSR